MNRAVSTSLTALCVLSLALSNMAISGAASIVRHTSPTGIEYASGGVGDERQDAMDAMRHDFNLQLTFARPKSGHYVIDVKVSVENAQHEKVLDAVSTGPMFFATLPAGDYTVTADAEGQPQSKSATISKGYPSGLVFYFADRD
jgi:hypothetical protein